MWEYNDKHLTNDSKNEPGLPSEVGGGEKPKQTEPDQGAGDKKTEDGGVVQTPQEVTPKAGSVGVGGDVVATTQALKKLDDNGGLNKIFIEKEISIDDIAEESADGQKLSDAIVNVKDGLKSQTKGKILVYESGGKYYIADGFHRVAEAKLKGDKSIQADVVYAKPKDIAEAYHKAKADGSNPELVKAVEQSLKEAPENKPIPPNENFKKIDALSSALEGRTTEEGKKKIQDRIDALRETMTAEELFVEDNLERIKKQLKDKKLLESPC